MHMPNDINIEVAHRMGPALTVNRPMVTRLKEGEKKKVFSRISNIKETQNKQGCKYYVQDQLPDILNELIPDPNISTCNRNYIYFCLSKLQT